MVRASWSSNARLRLLINEIPARDSTEMNTTMAVGRAMESTSENWAYFEILFKEICTACIKDKISTMCQKSISLYP